MTVAGAGEPLDRRSMAMAAALALHTRPPHDHGVVGPATCCDVLGRGDRLAHERAEFVRWALGSSVCCRRVTNFQLRREGRMRGGLGPAWRLVVEVYLDEVAAARAGQEASPLWVVAAARLLVRRGMDVDSARYLAAAFSGATGLFVRAIRLLDERVPADEQLLDAVPLGREASEQPDGVRCRWRDDVSRPLRVAAYLRLSWSIVDGAPTGVEALP